MVAGVSMTQAKVQATLRAGHRDELLSLAALGIAAIGVDLLALRFALLVNVLANSDIGLHSGWRGHGLPTQWADGHLNVLLVGSWTAVAVVAVVRGAEDLVARVALNGQKIQSVARCLTAVLSQVWKFHDCTSPVTVFLYTKQTRCIGCYIWLLLGKLRETNEIVND